MGTKKKSFSIQLESEAEHSRERKHEAIVEPLVDSKLERRKWLDLWRLFAHHEHHK